VVIEPGLSRKIVVVHRAGQVKSYRSLTRIYIDTAAFEDGRDVDSPIIWELDNQITNRWRA